MSIGLCRLDALADVKLGVKTFLNPFFYIDRDRIEQFGVEPRFLEPVFRTADAKRENYLQSAEETKLQIFHCDQRLEELTGTGAAAYVTWASKQRHSTKNGVPGGYWKDTPAVKPKTRDWYRNQAMPPPARIVLLKAFDDYFAPFILDKKVRVDQRFNQLNAKDGVEEELLIGLLCSTWFVMTVETRGRTAMGQGALEMPTDTLREIEVPDIRKLNSLQASAWREATSDVLGGKRRPITELVKDPAQKKLDGCVLEALDLDVSRTTELYEDTIRMRRIRTQLATGRGAMKRERFEADVAQVAKEIAAEVNPLLGPRRFPDDYLEKSASTQPVQLGSAPLMLEATGVMGQHRVTASVEGEPVFEADLIDPIGEVFIRAVQLGRRNFRLPTDERDAARALQEFDRMVFEVDSRLTELAAGVGAAAQSLIRELAEEELNFPVSRLLEPAAGSFSAKFQAG